MRTVIILALVAGGAFMAGWFTIHRDGDQTWIGINKQEIREDASKAIAKGRQYLDQREQERLAREQANAQAAPAWPNTAPGYSQPAPGYPQNYQPAPQYNGPAYQSPQYTGAPNPGIPHTPAPGAGAPGAPTQFGSYSGPSGYSNQPPVQGAGYSTPPNYSQPAGGYGNVPPWANPNP